MVNVWNEYFFIHCQNLQASGEVQRCPLLCYFSIHLQQQKHFCGTGSFFPYSLACYISLFLLLLLLAYAIPEYWLQVFALCLCFSRFEIGNRILFPRPSNVLLHWLQGRGGSTGRISCINCLLVSLQSTWTYLFCLLVLNV